MYFYWHDLCFIKFLNASIIIFVFPENQCTLFVKFYYFKFIPAYITCNMLSRLKC